MAKHSTTLAVAPPFDLLLCLFGHGWVALAPHEFDEATQTFTTVLRLGGQAVDATLRQTGKSALTLQLQAQRRLPARDVRLAAAQLRHMLRLDDDLSAFHARCAKEPSLRWAARRGAGRLLRSAGVFEDLMKLLFTTNTTWAGTESMTKKLVADRGSVAPSGRRAFPSPEQCRADAAFYRDVVRAGYRGEAAAQLADDFATGRLDDATFLAPQPAIELWQRLTSLRGFGPYAAGQAMRLLGHYEHLALDSWCRARLAQLGGKKKAPSDRAIEKRYARYAPFQGLAMWLELTAEWHGEGAKGGTG
ncbi:MAG: Fe-S cluster assembly protein HesB [Planctomycetes bacterium]|nr:Fe-S cluster assembly protein HesB [Planctomycetota bacterium]MCB9886594.1 Fe-S cluster assembly protein HesB [Planctomycetota bacterium]